MKKKKIHKNKSIAITDIIFFSFFFVFLFFLVFVFCFLFFFVFLFIFLLLKFFNYKVGLEDKNEAGKSA